MTAFLDLNHPELTALHRAAEPFDLDAIITAGSAAVDALGAGEQLTPQMHRDLEALLEIARANTLAREAAESFAYEAQLSAMGALS